MPPFTVVVASLVLATVIGLGVGVAWGAHDLSKQRPPTVTVVTPSAEPPGVGRA